MKRIFVACCMLMGVCSMAQTKKAANVVVVTLDGFRWQEMFGGADEQLINDPAFSFDTASLKKRYWAATPQERRAKLLPFIWNTIAKQGQLHGNRILGSNVNVQNRYWFSYPGYNEIFSGYPDTLVNSNDPTPNANVTVLEFLNNQPAFKGKVAAFTSWDCFNGIFNEKRAGFPVSAGFDSLTMSQPAFRLLNEMQFLSPQPLGEGVRPDHLTYTIGKEYLRQYKPRVLYIGFDETDDYAHGGRYDFYLNTAHATDKWLADLWNTLQSMPQYRNNTTLLITTDHGRGDKVKKEWTSHGSEIEGADQIWFAAIGAGIKAEGESSKPEQLYQAQIASTIAALLGLRFTPPQPAAVHMPVIMK